MAEENCRVGVSFWEDRAGLRSENWTCSYFKMKLKKRMKLNLKGSGGEEQPTKEEKVKVACTSRVPVQIITYRPN